MANPLSYIGSLAFSTAVSYKPEVHFGSVLSPHMQTMLWPWNNLTIPAFAYHLLNVILTFVVQSLFQVSTLEAVERAAYAYDQVSSASHTTLKSS
jgi:hypothetical protein